MYRRLKNILGVSLMILAVVISQVPMPEAQAEIAKEITEQGQQADDSVHVVTFSMNGGTFSGTYNGYSFMDKTPVLVVDDGDAISTFPDDKLASYSGYKTEAGIWYTDKDCLTKYDINNPVIENMTLYKKWYSITSDGTTHAARGFHISADGTVLYQYDGDDKNVVIPQTVQVIAEGAFDSLDQVRAVTLPANISKIEKNAFSGLKDGSIVYIYDSNTADSKAYGKQLDAAYDQLVYSEYLDADKTEKIAGIENLSETESEEVENEEDSAAESEPQDDIPAESKTEGSSTEESKTEESKTEESSTQESKTEDSSTEESKTENSSTEERKTEESSTEESSSSVIVVEPDQKYMVTFDTGIAGVRGEKREVLSGRTVSEEVAIDGSQPRILRKDNDKIEQDDGKQEITYTFKGWYKDNACTQEWNFASDVIEQNTTIYAKWDCETKAYFTVTYSTTKGNEGASNIPDKQKLYADEKLVKPSKKPSVKNKTFKGWYTSAEDTKSPYKKWGKPVTEDLTLYAHFEEKSNTVVFHMNGGGFTGKYNGTSYTDAASLTAKIAIGKGISAYEYPANSETFKYSNYSTDSNWYTDKECLSAYAKKDSNGNDTVVKEDLTLYKKWYYTSSGFTMNASNNVLYKYSGGVSDVVIPETVTVIGSDAFASVGGISSIILPDAISEVKDNAFSGVNNVSKDITITGNTENAINIAKELANKYKRLVYKESDAVKIAQNNSSVVSKAESGSIKLGATVSGSTQTTNNNTAAAVTSDNTSLTGTIALGTNSVNTQSMDMQSASATQSVSNLQSAAQSASSAQPTAFVQRTPSTSTEVIQDTKTTQRSNTVSASAPKSTQHIKDSTPKTGDPLQYRMLIVCAMFSVGVLLILTGNEKKKKLSAS